VSASTGPFAAHGAGDPEAALYRLLDERLKGCTIVSIGHRSTLSAFHDRGLTLVREGHFHRIREAALEPAK